MLDANNGLTTDNLEEIIEHRWVFQKYIDVMIADTRIKLANLQMKGQEATAYLTIEILNSIKDDLNKSVDNFRIMIEEKKRKEQEEIVAE